MRGLEPDHSGHGFRPAVGVDIDHSARQHPVIQPADLLHPDEAAFFDVAYDQADFIHVGNEEGVFVPLAEREDEVPHRIDLGVAVPGHPLCDLRPDGVLPAGDPGCQHQVFQNTDMLVEFCGLHVTLLD